MDSSERAVQLWAATGHCPVLLVPSSWMGMQSRLSALRAATALSKDLEGQGGREGEV